jgi:hypothetical protein
MLKCCTGPRKKLKHGTIVSGDDDIISSLQNSIKTSHEIRIWDVRLSETVKNPNIIAHSYEEALRLAQWYAYLDYKELKSCTSNESQEVQ